MIYVYIGCLTFGILYSIISAILGHHDFEHGGIDGSGLDGSVDAGIDLGLDGGLDAGLDLGLDGGLDAGLDLGLEGGLDAGFDGGIDTQLVSDVHGHSDVDANGSPSLFSPIVIASAIATFGGVGIIGKLGFDMSDLLSAVVALTSAGVIGAGIFFGIVKFMFNSQSNSMFSQRDFIGREAEVILPITANGLGEISFIINGMRRKFPAKSANKEAIKQGAVVKIKDISGNVAHVARIITIDEIELLDFKYEKPKSKEED